MASIISLDSIVEINVELDASQSWVKRVSYASWFKLDAWYSWNTNSRRHLLFWRKRISGKLLLRTIVIRAWNSIVRRYWSIINFFETDGFTLLLFLPPKFFNFRIGRRRLFPERCFIDGSFFFPLSLFGRKEIDWRFEGLLAFLWFDFVIGSADFSPLFLYY